MRTVAKFFVVALIALLLSIIFSTAQTAFAQTYTSQQRTGASIVPGTTDTGNHCADCTTSITLPFKYELYGTTFTSANVSSNGNIQFTSKNDALSNTSLPAAGFTDTIFLYWADLDTSATASGEGIFTSISGAAPNRIFNIEWRTVRCCGHGAPDNIFEVRLFEGAQRFDIIYGPLTSTGDRETVGVQNDNALDFTQYEFNTPGTLFNGLHLILATSPTAADSTINGRITTSDGPPLAGTTVSLSGTQERKTITDANGNYHFDDVETGGFYTVRPSRVNYSFAPAERSFSQLGNQTEAGFTGSPAASGANPLETPEYFVRQHYLDFLGREPDESGFNFWSDQMLECGADAGCLERRRINVSAAYFLSIEFQQTGGLVDSLYRASYGRRPLYGEFMPDTESIAQNVVVGRDGWAEQLAANKHAFVDAWLQRPDFIGAYGNLNNDAYVDELISHTGVDYAPEERNALLSDLANGALTRAGVLLRIVEDDRLVQAKRNEAFVMMEYFGYLRRDPDDSGYQFWLNKLNQFGGNFERAEMVKAFINSGEYRARFPR